MKNKKPFSIQTGFSLFIVHNSVYIQERPQLTSPVMLIYIIFTVYKWGVYHT